jgi:hypothetical protein
MMTRHEALGGRGTRFFVLADARQAGHYRIWDSWTARPLSGPAHCGLAAAEHEARRMNGARA